MKLIPVIVPVIGFVSGIALVSLHNITHFVLIWFLILALASFLFWIRHEKEFGAILWYYLSVFLIGVAVGSWWMNKNVKSFDDSYYQNLIQEEVELEGVVGRDVERGMKNAKVFLETNDGNILVFLDRHTNLNYGDRIRVVGKLELPEPFLTDLGREFDYKNYLRAQRVGFVMRYPEPQILAANEGNAMVAGLLRIKAIFRNSLESSLSQPASGLALGLLLGDKGAISDELEEVFRRSGVIHIVVLSGYNIMLVVGFVLFILGRLVKARARFVLGVVAIASFACLVGFSATVLRASLMAALLLYVELTGRRYNALRALLVAGVVMLIINPYLLLYDVGFQLSFVATWGLIVFSPTIEKFIKFIPEILGLRTLVAATLSTQIAVLPLLLYQIGEMSLVSIITNVLVLPMVPVAMLFAFLLGVFGLISVVLTAPVLIVAHVSLIYIVEVASKLAELPLATMLVPAFPSVLVFLMYAFLIYLWLRPKVDKKESINHLVGWTIVEEGELNIKKEAVVTNDTASSVPIFFR
jgi:competence protein ComEC